MQAPLPRHVAVIMDGNRRWARAKGLPVAEGHRRGADAAERLGDLCVAAGVQALTLYAFSTENKRRPGEEVQEIMSLLRSALKRRKADHARRRHTAIRFLGDRSFYPADILDMVNDAESETPEELKLRLNVALGYGSRAEITDAVRKLSGTPPEQVNEDLVASALYTAGLPDPDLLIRTGGERRLSNFLLWQCAYTELYFTDVLWPDFGEAAFKAALEDYAKRERRYGAQ